MQPRFASGNAGVFVANVFVELLHTENADEASAPHFSTVDARGAAR
jgi:hypothetical protein